MQATDTTIDPLKLGNAKTYEAASKQARDLIDKAKRQIRLGKLTDAQKNALKSDITKLETSLQNKNLKDINSKIKELGKNYIAITQAPEVNATPTETVVNTTPTTPATTPKPATGTTPVAGATPTTTPTTQPTATTPVVSGQPETVVKPETTATLGDPVKTDIVSEGGAKTGQVGEAYDGIPDKIRTGVEEIEDAERKNHLIKLMSTELNGVINEYFGQESMKTNLSSENQYISQFMSEFLGADISTKVLKDKTYEESRQYYTKLLKYLIDTTKGGKATKVAIPKSAELSANGDLIIENHSNKANRFNGKYFFEGKEVENYYNALVKLQKNAGFLSGKTVDKIYTLGMDKVDTDTVEVATAGDYNRQLAEKTDYYRAIQGESLATNNKLNDLAKEYTAEFQHIQEIKKEIKTKEFTLTGNPNDTPLDRLTAQLELITLNQDLLDRELKALSKASLINLIAGPDTPGVIAQDAIKTRMEKIKEEIKTNANKVSTWLETNEKNYDTLLNSNIGQSDKTRIKNNISSIKAKITPEYVAQQEGLVTSLQNIITETESQFAAISKPYQEKAAQLHTLESEKKYREDKQKSLDPDNPRYATLTSEYGKQIIAKEKEIKTLTEAQEGLLTNLKALKNKQDLKDLDKKFLGDVTHGEKLYMPQQEANKELKLISQDTQWSELLKNKQNVIQGDIDKQIKGNKTKIEEKANLIEEEQSATANALVENATKITKEETTIKEELAKAQQDQPYDMEKVLASHDALTKLYQEKKDLSDKYNNAFYEDQLNYQRELNNAKISTDGHVNHTQQNVDRITKQLDAINAEIEMKEATIDSIKTQLNNVLEAAIIDPTGPYQTNYDSEVERLVTALNSMVKDLTGDNSVVDKENYLTTITNLSKFDKNQAKANSLYKSAADLTKLKAGEDAELTKWKLTQKYEYNRLAYVGANAQRTILKEKIKDYDALMKQFKEEQSQQERIIVNSELTIKNSDGLRKQHMGNIQKMKEVNDNYAKAKANIESATKQLTIIGDRISRLQRAIDDANASEKAMNDNVAKLKKTMDKSEQAMRNNTTPIYSDENSTLYTPEAFNTERMEYIPYHRTAGTTTNNKSGSSSVSE